MKEAERMGIQEGKKSTRRGGRSGYNPKLKEGRGRGDRKDEEIPSRKYVNSRAQGGCG